jgi:tight adherence protein C
MRTTWWVIAGTVSVAVGLAMAVVVLLMPRAQATGVARSLELVRTGSSRRPLDVGESISLVEQSSWQRIGRPMLSGLVRVGARITLVGTPQRLRRRMDLAGNNAPWTVEGILVGKAIGTLGLGGLGLLVWVIARSGPGLLVFVAASALGYWLIDLLLINAGLKRQAAMRRAIPDALDMLVVCVEAGLGFDAGVARVAQNTRGPLALEFSRVLKEIQLGRSRSEALGELAARTEVTEIRSFVAALVQADRLGIPVAGVLREQAADMRVRRRQRAEEQAQKIPVKIIFPVLFCIFPVFFVIVIGPGALRIAQVFLGG